MKTRRKLSGIALTLFMMMGILAGPAGASEVDLGSPATMSELLDSPEYRAWHGDVLRLYQAFFNRDPDVGGSIYWIDKYEDGSTLDDIAWGFSNSTEFQNQYGSTLANSEFLTIVYSNVLGRAPDQEGFDYWLGQMNGGLTQHGVVRWVVANQEFVSNYPFAGTTTPLSDYLLSPNQVAGHTSTYPSKDKVGPSREYEMNECDSRRVLPKNVAGVIYAINNNADLEHFVYEFSTVEAAQAYIASKREITTFCQNTPYGERTMTVADLPADGIGDEAVAHEFVVLDADDVGYHWQDIFIRIDRLVIVVDVTTSFDVSPGIVFDYAAAAAAHANAVNA